MENEGLTLTTSLLPGGDGPTDIIPVEKMKCQLVPPFIISFHHFAAREVGWKFSSLSEPTDTTPVGEMEGQLTLPNCCPVGPDLSISICHH